MDTSADSEEIDSTKSSKKKLIANDFIRQNEESPLTATQEIYTDDDVTGPSRKKRKLLLSRHDSNSLDEEAPAAFTHHGVHHEHSVMDDAKPHPVYYKKEKELNPLYNGDIKISYLKQIYEKKQTLGHGSFGSVIKIVRREDQTPFAVKIIKKGRNGYNERHNEAKIFEQIGKHRNIIQYFEAWEERNELFIVMELCEIDLDTYSSEKHNISEEEVWDILCDMLKALQYLHKRNLIHVDVKPGNIMISSNGLYKLGDFGMAINVVEFKKSKQAQHFFLSEGDGKYLAPETLQGKFTKFCDVFSLGITLLELGTDIELPRNGPRWDDLRNDVFPDGLRISDDLITLLKAMMKSSYLRRPGVGLLLRRTVVKKQFSRHRRNGRTNHWLEWKSTKEEENADDITYEQFVVNLNLPLVECGSSNTSSVEPKTPPHNVSQVRLFKSF